MISHISKETRLVRAENITTGAYPKQSRNISGDDVFIKVLSSPFQKNIYMISVPFFPYSACQLK